MLDDSAPARHSTECGEFVQRRLRMSEDQIAGCNQGPPRGYVVCEDRLVWQNVMCGPYEMHAQHPAGPQPDKEPNVRHPSHDRKASAPGKAKANTQCRWIRRAPPIRRDRDLQWEEQEVKRL